MSAPRAVAFGRRSPTSDRLPNVPQRRIPALPKVPGSGSCGCEALQRYDGSGQSVGRLEDNAHPAMAKLFVDDISFPKRQKG